MHNSHLLPKLQLQLEIVLDAYGKFEPIVYDTQGPNDAGTDLAVRYRPKDSDTEDELICFQVKSFDDLKKKGYMQELKAQRDESFRKVKGMVKYFLLLCTDVKEHRERVRYITAEFRDADRTEVIEPSFAYTFLGHPKTRVDALVKRTQEAEDLVFRLALESLELSSPSARALGVFMVVKLVTTGVPTFSVEQLLADFTLRTIYSQLRYQQLAPTEERSDGAWSEENYAVEPIQAGEFEDQMAEDLSLLETDFVKADSASQIVHLQTDRLQALNAVVADALARYEYNDDQLMAYMFSLMGIRD